MSKTSPSYYILDRVMLLAAMVGPVCGNAFPTPARRARGVVLDTTLADDVIGKMPAWRPASRACVKHRVSQRRETLSWLDRES